MFHQSYLDTIEDSRELTRSREQEAFRNAIRAMEKAQAEPGDAATRARAIFEIGRLWSFLLEDLASSENAYPPELRAQLISIGIYVLRQCENLRKDDSAEFSGLIEISRSIEQGLS